MRRLLRADEATLSSNGLDRAAKASAGGVKIGTSFEESDSIISLDYRNDNPIEISCLDGYGQQYHATVW